MKSALLALIAIGCVPPGDPGTPSAPVSGDAAIYEVQHGDTLLRIAARLGYRGGWRELARQNGVQRPERLRTGKRLLVQLEQLRPGADPYDDLGLEHYEPLPSQPLIACRTEHARGPCATLGDATLCVEATAPEARAGIGSFDEDDLDLDDPSQDGRELVLYRGSDRRWIAALPSKGPLELDAHRIDLDGDHRDELVVAVPIAVHSHLGFRYARVFVIDGELVTQLDVSQWGEGSLVEGRERGCDLLATSWDDFTHPIEGDGCYFIGRRLGYARGALVPPGEIAVRRLRDGFHALVLDGIDDDAFGPAFPADWLSTGGSWWSDRRPGLGDTVLHPGDATGVVERVEVRRDGFALAIARDNGDHITLDPAVRPYADQHDRWSLDGVSWAPTGGAFPAAYVPAEPSRWIGARAVIDRRSDDSGHACDPQWGCPYRSHVVWLEPR